MADPLFKVGDLVRVRGSFIHGEDGVLLDSISPDRVRGIFEVLACLPGRDGKHHYRLKGGEPRHERIAGEDRLMRASKPLPRP